MNYLVKLKGYLKKHYSDQTGGDSDLSELPMLLANCWDLFEGSSDTKMDVFKIHRIENIKLLSPNILQFEIERHGSTSMSSIYADIHQWTVDVEEMTAECNPFYKKRQVYPRDKPLKTKPLAEKISKEIFEKNKESEFLKWKSDCKVQVLIGRLIPETVYQTTTERRKRFRRDIEAILIPKGWIKTKAYNIYEKNESSKTD